MKFLIMKPSSLPICVQILSWADHVSRIGEGKNAFKILTGKPTRKKPLGRLIRLGIRLIVEPL